MYGDRKPYPVALITLNADELAKFASEQGILATDPAVVVKHPKVVRVVALSGGYTRKEGNERLRRNHGVVASFSRALVEGLSAQQSDAEFNAMLDASIQSIFDASNT